MTLQGYQQLDLDAVRSYVADLWNILDESEVAQLGDNDYIQYSRNRLLPISFSK